MAFKANNGSLMSEINVTPFVDVMLVLLIIFMVAAPMMVEGVDVDLPQTTAKPLSNESEPLVVTVDQEGGIHINTLEVALDALEEKITKILETRQDKEVFFRADKDVAYGRVIQVMSELKNAGIEKLGMVTVPIEDEPQQSGAPKSDVKS
ncbi:MAG: protein TolR [Desulfobacteraceae bacterium]|jgi:biopolymer transport protein TolR